MLNYFNNTDFPYVIRFAHQHIDFRLPEFLSLITMFNVSHLLKLPKDLFFLTCSPFLPVGGIPLDILKRIVSRSILIISLYYNYGADTTCDKLISLLKNSAVIGCQLADFKYNSFKFSFDIFGSSICLEEQLSLINEFSFLPLEGPIDLAKPDIIFTLFGCCSSQTWRFESDVWAFGRLICTSSRSLVDFFDLKKRSYIGITSMDAELSLIMSNMAQIVKGSLFLDPFVGTGSFLLTGAYFGGYSIGFDIDGRQIRGKDTNNINTNALQYNLNTRLLGTFISDITKSPLRPNLEIFDAIITDPPYGVRAGAKKITYLDSTLVPKNEDTMKPLYPKTIPYPTNQVYSDLLDFGSSVLKIGGRLVFWMPSSTEDKPEIPILIPSHPCFRLVAKSEQKLNKWSRWLITMEKNCPYTSKMPRQHLDSESHFFRDTYFRPKLT